MTQKLWSEVDDYLGDVLLQPDSALDAALAASRAAGLPEIAVTPNQGKFLHLLAQLASARTILEIGTLGGYSTIWLARALPADGQLITLEVNSGYAEVARANLTAAGVADLVDIRIGTALDTLPDVEGPMDLVFIDADKATIPHFFDWALRLSHPGSVIIIDNVVRGGAVVDAASTDPSVLGVRKLHELIAAEPRVEATALQTVGNKGYDGFTIAMVVS